MRVKEKSSTREALIVEWILPVSTKENVWGIWILGPISWKSRSLIEPEAIFYDQNLNNKEVNCATQPVYFVSLADSFIVKIFKIFETPSRIKPEQLHRPIKLLGSLRNMSQVLRYEGFKHSCAFLIETGPAQTTPIPQTLMLFSVILLNCAQCSWAQQTSTMSLSSQG